MVRFALDEDFPDTIIEALGIGVPEAELVPIRHIDPRLRGWTTGSCCFPSITCKHGMA